MNSVNSYNSSKIAKPQYSAKLSSVRFGAKPQASTKQKQTKDSGSISIWGKAWGWLQTIAGSIGQVLEAVWDTLTVPFKYLFPSMFTQVKAKPQSAKPLNTTQKRPKVVAPAPVEDNSEEKHQLRIEQNWNRIFQAIRTNDVDTVQAQLASVSEDERIEIINRTGAGGRTLFGEAASFRKHPELAQALLNSVSEANRTAIATHADQDGNTPLHWVASYGHLDVTQMLLNAIPQGQQISAILTPNKYGDNPLLNAARGNKPELLQHLIHLVPENQRSEVIGKANNGGMTPLLCAASSYPIEARSKMVQNLLNSVPEAERAPLINRSIYPEGNLITERYSLLGNAASLHEYGLVQTIMNAVPVEERGVLINHMDRKGYTTLMRAVEQGGAQMVQTLFEGIPADQRTALLNQPIHNGRTAFSEIFYRNRQEITPILFDWVPEEQRSNLVNHIDNQGCNALHDVAAYGRNPELLATLLRYAPPGTIRQMDDRLNTLIHKATQSGKPAMVQAVLTATPKAERSEFIQQVNIGGQTPLHKAVDNSIVQPILLKTLLDPVVPTERVAFVNQASNSGQTPLHVVEQYANNLRINDRRERNAALLKAGILLAYGAEPTHLSRRYRTQVLANIRNWDQDYRGRLFDSDNPAEVRKAMQWYQQFPISRPEDLDKQQGGQSNAEPANNGPEQQQNQPSLDWQPTIQQCNQTLQEKARQLSSPYLTRRQKIAILARCRPILKSGIPINPDLQSQLLIKAQEVKYMEFLRDAIVEDFNYTTVNALKELMTESSLQNDANATQENTTTPQ